MSDNPEVTYALDSCAGRQGRRDNKTFSDRQMPDGEAAGRSIPRIARLMALAIRFEGLLRDETIRDYAELARLGRVTRARMTQIMKLLDLAPDIQEQILFLPLIKGLNERNLRPIASRIDWDEQRRMFQKITGRLHRTGEGGAHSADCEAAGAGDPLGGHAEGRTGQELCCSGPGGTGFAGTAEPDPEPVGAGAGDSGGSAVHDVPGRKCRPDPGAELAEGDEVGAVGSTAAPV